MLSLTVIGWIAAALLGPMGTEAQDPVFLHVFDKDNAPTTAAQEKFCRAPNAMCRFAGDHNDLDDREVEWNDRIRSVILHGPPGTTVWLYDAKGFGRGDDILEIKVPEGQTSVTCNDLNHLTVGMRWEVKKNGLKGKVSGIQWK